MNGSHPHRSHPGLLSSGPFDPLPPAASRLALGSHVSLIQGHHVTSLRRTGPALPAAYLDKQTDGSSWGAGCTHCPHGRKPQGFPPGSGRWPCGCGGRTLSRWGDTAVSGAAPSSRSFPRGVLRMSRGRGRGHPQSLRCTLPPWLCFWGGSWFQLVGWGLHSDHQSSNICPPGN